MRDVSREIIEVGKAYHFTKPPQAVEDFLLRLSKLLRAILQFLHDLFQPHGGAMDSRSMSGLLQLAIYAVTGIAIVWLAIMLWRRARTARNTTAKTTKGATLVEELLDAQGWARQADKLAAAGDYRGACRAMYLSLLQQLHENQIAVFAPAKTNFEYSYSLAKYPALQAPFKEVAERVELIWFGNKEATDEDFSLSKQQVSQMDGDIRRIGAVKAEGKLAKV